eukprot:m.141857 g.141857  ORF g.141857 m.141857 type:complete len:262 (+) comp22887_c0_seq1:2127-2912(+)
MSSKLDKRQRDKLKQFQETTGTGGDQAVALACLKAHKWSLETSVDAFFTDSTPYYAVGSRGKKKTNTKKIQTLFKKYEEKGEGSRAILIDGMVQLCTDLGVDPSDPALLVLSWRCEAAKTCRFSESEFTEGLERLGCDSLELLKKALPTLRQELEEPGSHKEIYTFTYDWAKEEGQKSLQLEMAVGLWQLLLTGKFALLDDWTTFVTEHAENRPVPKDVWNMLLDFATEVKSDLSNYDPYGSWPTMIDEFVDWYKEAKGIE